MSQIESDDWYLVTNSMGSLVRRRGSELEHNVVSGSERLKIVGTNSAGATIVEREVVRPERRASKQRSHPRILVVDDVIGSGQTMRDTLSYLLTMEPAAVFGATPIWYRNNGLELNLEFPDVKGPDEQKNVRVFRLKDL